MLILKRALFVAAAVTSASACSKLAETGVSATQSELKTKNWSDEDCKNRSGELKKISKNAKQSVEAALAAISSEKGTPWNQFKNRKEGCYAVKFQSSTAKKDAPFILSVSKYAIDALAAYEAMCRVEKSLASADFTFRCTDTDLLAFAIKDKYCDGKSIYVGAYNVAKEKNVFDEYNSSISQRDSKLVVAECGKASSLFDENDD